MTGGAEHLKMLGSKLQPPVPPLQPQRATPRRRGCDVIQTFLEEFAE
jgi:hypothetical protein